MKPEWMPPLPDKFPGEVKRWMLYYAEQYRRAWVASLKPVAWMYRPRKSHLEFMLTTRFMYPSSEYETIHLYRLDGGENE
jgi:hypothetical protein